MSSFFSRIKAGLAKTAQQIRERLGDSSESDVAAPTSGSSPSTGRAATLVETPEAIEEALIAADVGLPATERILTAVRAERHGSLRERVAAEVRRMLTDVKPTVESAEKPHVVLIVGVNGTGKTTTVGKLAHLYRSMGRSV